MSDGIIFEFIPMGNFVKVTALDVETKIEASTITPANIPLEQQKQAALNKLRYVIQKLKQETLF